MVMTPRQKQRAQLIGIPLLVGAIAVAVLLGIVNARPEPQIARVTSRTLVDGEMVAKVEAPAPYDPSAVIVADVVLPVEYQTETTVPVHVLSDRSVEVAEPGFRMPRTGLLVAVALLGAGFGLVIVNNLRGYGFVRGTGQPGTMQQADVREDRGFYWRS